MYTKIAFWPPRCVFREIRGARVKRSTGPPNSTHSQQVQPLGCRGRFGGLERSNKHQNHPEFLSKSA